MSRAVQEDLSDLSFSEKVTKRWANFKTWLYNAEDGSIMGERSAKQWGQLGLYYLVFYLFLSAFTAIFFSILGFMLPLRPVEYVKGVCSNSPVAKDFCGNGPTFHIIDLNEVDGDVKETDGIYKYGLCEAAFVGIPRELSVRAAEPTFGYSFDAGRKGYQLFMDEVNRVFCLGSKENSDFNPDCQTATKGINTRILPLVPRDIPDFNAGASQYLHTATDFEDALKRISDTAYTKPKPYFSTPSHETYMVFLRFNKVWNYQPYATSTSMSNDTTTLAQIQNDIGVTCILSSTCSTGTGVNYKGEFVACDDATVSADKKITITMLSNVMTNYDGFPWRGGALNMNFGSLAVTIEKDAALAEQTIQCTMGVSIENGNNGVSASGSAVGASAKAINNMDKYAYARAYTRSKGKSISIPIN